MKTAWRNLWKNKTSAIISILGLSLGIACFLLLGTYVLNESRVDRFHPYAERIAWVTAGYQSPEDPEMRYMEVTPNAVAPTFSEQFSEVEKATRIYRRGTMAVKHGERLFNESGIIYADSTFFEILTYPFVAGDPHTALSQPQSVVLTAAMAQKYFDGKNPIGRTILLNESPWQITGVVETPPTYTQLQFSAVLPYHSMTRASDLIWHSANDVTLLLLNDQKSFAPLQQQVNSFIGELFAESIKTGYQYVINIEPLADVHLHSKAAGTGNITYLYILGAIAVGLLLIACINFTNLVTARSAERAQEIGVKKVLGAGRGLLFRQFLFESALMVLLGIGIGLLFAVVALPVFNNYVHMNISMAHWGDIRFYLGAVVLFVVISLVAGGWPALVLSAFKPISVLKGKITRTRDGGTLRKVLVVFQFCISLLFIICTVIAGRQLHYIQTKDTGLNRSQVVVLDGASLSSQTIETFKSDALGRAGIQSVTASYDSPVNVQGGYTIMGADGKDSDFRLSITAIPVEKDFAQVFELPVLAGSTLTDADVQRANVPDYEAREYAFIINELAAQTMGWTAEEAIGKWINMNNRKGRIKAVTANFNFASLHTEIQPIVLFPEYNYFGKVFVRTAEGTSMAQNIDAIKTAWETVNPNKPFDFHFLDQEYDDLYQQEMRTAKVLNLFALVTILVAAMGLFGLAAFTTQQRVKEIGIRKVLGASVMGIVHMLSADFVKLVVIATAIASPIAWWLMSNWLTAFVYRIDIEWWMFALAAVFALTVAILTVSSQALKAALANPVDSLRDE
ncbi:ABC transporter permease [Parapedobacter sp. ISTM3]|uniref:ABC transporter permease n=1 Tax=Parapedobacter sp. ISTM3 TaxID=2800130 RepID=UPI001907AF9B|nr:ABC transporter permease [Parapedobacter sp. ISTM3]MBK1441163.1 ABC transporter permease [Parapedobacter sp. ISTM3]